MNEPKLGSLWEKRTEKAEFMSGEIDLRRFGGPERFRIIVFRNRKNKDSQPDWQIFESKPKPSGMGNMSPPAESSDIPW